MIRYGSDCLLKSQETKTQMSCDWIRILQKINTTDQKPQTTKNIFKERWTRAQGNCPGVTYFTRLSVNNLDLVETLIRSGPLNNSMLSRDKLSASYTVLESFRTVMQQSHVAQHHIRELRLEIWQPLVLLGLAAVIWWTSCRSWLQT